MRRFWWCFLFMGLCVGIYSHAVHKKRDVLSSLNSRLLHLQDEKQLLLQEKEELLLHINSESDPAWIELMLMKGLGLVPDGQVKIYFQANGE